MGRDFVVTLCTYMNSAVERGWGGWKSVQITGAPLSVAYIFIFLGSNTYN